MPINIAAVGIPHSMKNTTNKNFDSILFLQNDSSVVTKSFSIM